MHRFNFKSAIFASIIATIAMTIWMFLLRMDIMGVLGMTAGMTGAMRYVVGGLIHFGVGIFWGIIYAAFFEPWLKKLPRFLSGALFSLVPFFCAFLFMGPFLNTIQSVFHANETRIEIDVETCQMGCCAGTPTQQSAHRVNPEAKQLPVLKVANTPCCAAPMTCDPCAVCPPCGLCMPCAPCNPCAMTNPNAKCAPANPCAMSSPKCAPVNPCAMNKTSPTNPCAMKKAAPCAMKKNAPVNPCAMGSCCMPSCCASACPPVGMMKKGPPMWVWALLNHLVYGIVLGLSYRPSRKE